MSDEPLEPSSPAEVPAPERVARRTNEQRPTTIAETRLGVGDGFKFGCGFLMAAGIALLVGLLALSAGFLIASLLGIPLPLGGA